MLRSGRKGRAGKKVPDAAFTSPRPFCEALAMKITLDLPEWVVQELRKAPLPVELAGHSLEDRIAYLADEAALAFRARRESAELHRLFGLGGLDDEIPF